MQSDLHPPHLFFLAQVVPSSLLEKNQASYPDSQEINTSQDAAREESPLEAHQSHSSDSEMENNDPTGDGEVAYVCVCVCLPL